MTAALRIPLQVLLYGAFVAFIGYFATAPAYVALPAGEALLRLSIRHASQLLRPCHTRTTEELAKLAPNMRAPQACPRERSPVAVAIEIDGRMAAEAVAQPTGLSHDGTAVIYRRFVIPAGAHHIRAQLSDHAAGTFNWKGETRVDLAAGDALVIDFDASRGGFVFHR